MSTQATMDPGIGRDDDNEPALRFAELETPVGVVRVVAAAGVIRRVDLATQDRFRDVPADGHRPDEPVLRRAVEQLREYFAGARLLFDLPLAPEGGTPFQRRAWQALCAIPFGHTRSYGDQARAIGTPAAVRAVGAANARNPIGIIVPCHRVIGSDGKLTGYGGGLPAKKWLLEHEARVLAATTGGQPPSVSPARAHPDQIELFDGAAT
jgi:methylated-DNA-[protein]-cysteine S-methyltransferase